MNKVLVAKLKKPVVMRSRDVKRKFAGCFFIGHEIKHAEIIDGIAYSGTDIIEVEYIFSPGLVPNCIPVDESRRVYLGHGIGYMGSGFELYREGKRVEDFISNGEAEIIEY